MLRRGHTVSQSRSSRARLLETEETVAGGEGETKEIGLPVLQSAQGPCSLPGACVPLPLCSPVTPGQR